MDPQSRLKTWAHSFKVEQEQLCAQKLDMLRNIYKDKTIPRPLTYNDYMIRGYRCGYTDFDILNPQFSQWKTRR